MIAQLYTVSFLGVQAKLVEVQAQLSPGLPSFTIVGLPDKAVAESRERIRACFHGMSLDVPAARITINLTPADLPKEGSHFDLPIALALLTAMGVLKPDDVKHLLVLGEITLDGRILKVPGALPAALLASEQNFTLVCPHGCGPEAAWAGKVEIVAAEDMRSLLNHLQGKSQLPSPEAKLVKKALSYKDMADVKGQTMAKRALEIAAAGGHNVMMIGPPGSGKSMLAARMPSILPPLNAKEALDVTVIHSVAGVLQQQEQTLIQERPFRDPHHSASQPALVGGGQKCKPGEISLAHNGVLFLDELPEFPRQCLESLRQPMETGNISIARVHHHYTYPANFQCIAAMNPCRCGFFGDKQRQCSKAPKCAEDYQQRISGPMMDRFDLIVHVAALKPEELQDAPKGEESASIQKRVSTAREIQHKRNDKQNINAALEGKSLEKVLLFADGVKELIGKAIERFQLTGRGYHRLMRTARTIADLDKSEIINKNHVLEAISYRKL